MNCKTIFQTFLEILILNGSTFHAVMHVFTVVLFLINEWRDNPRRSQLVLCDGGWWWWSKL